VGRSSKSSNNSVPVALDPVASAKAVGLRYVTGEEPGIRRKRSGKHFLYMDSKNRPVRDEKTLQRIRSLVIPPAWEDVWICSIENSHLQATGRDQRGRKQYRYHPDYRQVRDQNKFGRMLAFADALPKLRHRVKEDLQLPGMPREKVLAAVVTLLDRTCIRVGNEEYAKENDSYGLSTMEDRHVKISKSDIRFHFRGKSGQEHDVELHDPKLAKIVKNCRDLPGHQLFQYRDTDGRVVDVDSGDVNEYLKQITGEDFTAKDFRTWHGTGHMAQRLAEMGRAQSKTEMKRNIVAAIKATASFLGNRPATCKKYYIHPCVPESYTAGTIFAVMEKLTEDKDLQPCECAIKVLVAQYVSSSTANAGNILQAA
jgi:DNA topoisomerase I